MVRYCCSVPSVLFLTLLTTHHWLGYYVFAIPEKREDEALRREYPLEEFLWTGSGDGPEHADSGGVSWLTTTVFRTTTRLLAPPASVSLLIEPTASCPQPASCLPHPSPTRSVEAATSAVFSLEPSETGISPTFSTKGSSATPSLHTPIVTQMLWPVIPSDRPPDSKGETVVPEQRFWIVTVVEEEDKRRAPETPILEVGLARLYATAFKRQQEKHLGLVNGTNGAALAKQFRLSGVISRRRRVASAEGPTVFVRVHNVSEGSPRRKQLVYSVHVRGRPVLARAAVYDMRLVSDAEVAQELGGLAVVTKAEPYLKEREEASWQTYRTSPWVLAGGAISAVALLLLVICLFVLATSRHKRARRIAGHQREAVSGTINESFEGDERGPASEHSSAASDRKILPSDEDEYDSESIDIPPPSAEAAALAVSAAVAAARSRSTDSPTSYLSMPSVRRFPRGVNIPEPLSQVLQGAGDARAGCLSVKNLDVYPDESVFEPDTPVLLSGVRHGSLDGEDPGVIGPCVYQMSRGAAASRRRFQELLDDTFSLFGGRSDEERSPTPPPRPPSPRINVDSRVHSAAQARVSEPESPPAPRPKTSSQPARRVMQHPRRTGRPPLPNTQRACSAGGPRGAWGTSTDSVRPLSAGPFHRPSIPRISVERILVDSQLPPTDPAIPVISAIKDELKKLQTCTTCSQLPGSTQVPKQ